MFTSSERESALAALKAKQQAYLQEAEAARQVPKRSLRCHIAYLLRAWAEALEPQIQPAQIAKTTQSSRVLQTRRMRLTQEARDERA